MQHTEVEVFLVRQMLHTGAEGVLQGTVVCPLGKDFVDSGVVDFRLAVVICGHEQALPWHPRVEDQ